MIRKEAWLFCRTSSSVRLYWELEEPKGPKGVNLLWTPRNLESGGALRAQIPTRSMCCKPTAAPAAVCEDRVLDGPALGGKGFNHRTVCRLWRDHLLDCLISNAKPMAPMPSQWLQRVPSPQTPSRHRSPTPEPPCSVQPPACEALGQLGQDEPASG